MTAAAYPVPIWLPRRRRIVSPAEWLRERERERAVSKAIATDANLGSNTSTSAMPSLVTALAASSASRIFFFAVYYSDTGFVTGMTAGGGLTWDVAGSHKHPDNGWRLTILTADAPSGLAQTTTLTSTNAGVVEGAVAAYSFTGMVTGDTGYLTGTPTGSDGYDQNWTSGNVTTTDADALVLCLHSGPGAATQSTTITAPPLELLDVGVAGDGHAHLSASYQIVSATGTYSVSGACAIGVYIDCDIILAVKAASGAPPPAGPKLRVHAPALRLR